MTARGRQPASLAGITGRDKLRKKLLPAQLRIEQFREQALNPGGQGSAHAFTLTSSGDHAAAGALNDVRNKIRAVVGVHDQTAGILLIAPGRRTLKIALAIKFLWAFCAFFLRGLFVGLRIVGQVW